MIPFNPATFVPSYNDTANAGHNTFGDMFGRWEDERISRQRQTEVERSNLVDEGQGAQQLGINESMNNRADAGWREKLKQTALEFHRAGQLEAADTAWKTADPASPPPWATEAPGMALPPGMLPVMPQAAPSPGLPEPEPLPKKPELPGGVRLEGGVPTMEFGVEEADAAMRDMPPAPPGMVPIHIPSEEPPAPPEPAAPGPQAPPAPAEPAPVSRLQGQYDAETKAVTDLFDALAKGEGELNADLAAQVRAMAPAAMDVVRRSGGSAQDAAKMLLDQYRSQARGNFGLETAKLKKKRGGGGGSAYDGLGGDKDNFNQVRATVKDVGLLEKASDMNKAEAAMSQALASASSSSSLGQRQALAGIIKSMFGAASSNQELSFVLNSGGVENKAMMAINNWTGEGEIPPKMIQAAITEMKRALALLEQRRAVTAQQAYDQIYNAGIPYHSEDERRAHAEWARNMFGRGGSGGFGRADDQPPPPIEGVEFDE